MANDKKKGIEVKIYESSVYNLNRLTPGNITKKYMQKCEKCEKLQLPHAWCLHYNCAATTVVQTCTDRDKYNFTNAYNNIYKETEEFFKKYIDPEYYNNKQIYNKYIKEIVSEKWNEYRRKKY